jgi:hypothetical protein
MIAYKISKHARILFVSINPHPGSIDAVCHFPTTKMFWYLLNRAGLPVAQAQHLLLGTASLSILSYEHNRIKEPVQWIADKEALAGKRVIERRENEGGEILRESKATNNFPPLASPQRRIGVSSRYISANWNSYSIL